MGQGSGGAAQSALRNFSELAPLPRYRIVTPNFPRKTKRDGNLDSHQFFVHTFECWLTTPCDLQIARSIILGLSLILDSILGFSTVMIRV